MPDSLSIFTKKVLILFWITFLSYLLYLLSDFLVVLFLSGFLTLLLSPILSSARKYHIPEPITLLLAFIILLCTWIIALFAIIPIFLEQITLLSWHVANNMHEFEIAYRSDWLNTEILPSFLAWMIGSFDISTLFDFIRNNASSLASMISESTKTLFWASTSFIWKISIGIFQFSLLLVTTFFLALERHNVKLTLYAIFPKGFTSYLKSREKHIEKILSSWIRWQILLGISLFFLTLVWLSLLSFFGLPIKHIFTLALIAGLMEFIPYIGPLLALLPALAVGMEFWWMGIFSVTLLYLIIQQLENNVLVPWIMSKSLNLSPLLIFLTMTIMASLFWIIGILLAIPTAAIVAMIAKDRF